MSLGRGVLCNRVCSCLLDACISHRPRMYPRSFSPIFVHAFAWVPAVLYTFRNPPSLHFKISLVSLVQNECL